ncbi:Mitochondrial metalloendopeptidase OMA1 [Lachnellula suecica]|uniref:Mitochondrial metalloendopeptidase OMA1 n=1 Tax=Lachnellula suecica TaxID=602035 RepID=A0A8T9CDA3_9HELO|nr:Mitochondrial metalloendopeptidase OMA1 [Lachnellula suecica]
MIPPALFRASLRALPEITPRATSRASLSPCLPTSNVLSRALQTSTRPLPRSKFSEQIQPSRPSPLQIRPFSSSNPRSRRPDRIYYKVDPSDPRDPRNAKPLITTEQLRRVVFHPSSKTLVLIVFVGGGLFYVSNLEEVPVSGRTRFNCYSDASVEAEGDMMYQKIMREARGSILPDWDSRVRRVRRVMERLVPVCGMEGVNWELHVIDSPGWFPSCCGLGFANLMGAEMNAFVIPGGKVFVFSGILPITKDDDGLAAVLGHEIAHNLAKHAAEALSSAVLLQPIRWGLIYMDYSGLTFGLGQILGSIAMDVGIMRRASRKQESEADYLGLMMMAKACYNPKAAVDVWVRMENANKNDIPGWLSTHPTNSTRISQMKEWLPKAESARRESDCAVTIGYAQGFQNAMGGWVNGSLGKM